MISSRTLSFISITWLGSLLFDSLCCCGCAVAGGAVLDWKSCSALVAFCVSTRIGCDYSRNCCCGYVFGSTCMAGPLTWIWREMCAMAALRPERKSRTLMFLLRCRAGNALEVALDWILRPAM